MNKLNQMASSATKEIENEKELFPKMTWKNSWKRVSHTDVTNSIKTFVNHNRTYWNAFFNELVQLYDVSVICHLVNEGMVYEENGKVIPKPKNNRQQDSFRRME
jgi:hypothetical protein